jgi:hypothetical protein
MENAKVKAILNRYDTEPKPDLLNDRDALDVIGCKLTGRDVMTLYVLWDRLQNNTSYWSMSIRALKNEVVVPEIFEWLVERQAKNEENPN